jgi:oligosaccharyltransferase complex subunit delta (ribophorin II)
MRILLILLLGVLCSGLSPASHLTEQDKTRLKSLFEQNCSADSDITSLYHCVQGLKLLGSEAGDKAKLCKVAASLADDASLEVLYAASGVGAALGCPVKLGAKGAEVVKSGSSDGSSSASLFFACNTLVNTGGKVDKSVLAALNSAIKKDDSLRSLGLAFHVASMIPGDVNKIYERIEDVVAQADEVDGKMLQFEGGLSVTSIVLTGAANLAAKAKKQLQISPEQAVKFANYLVSRKSVQQAKGALQLLEGIGSMTGSAQFTPVSVSLVSALSISTANPNVVVSVVDLKGTIVGDMKVTLDSASSSLDGSSLVTGKEMTKSGDGYSLNLMSLKPEPGFYDLTISAKPVKADPKLVGNQGVKLTVKVLAEQKITNAVLKVIDNDAGTKKNQLTYPQTSHGFSVRQKDRLQLTFSVVSAANSQPLTVHQAFVKVTHLESGAEIIYVAESDMNDLYKFEMDLDTEAELLKGSGKYSLSLMLGDAVVSNPITWVFGEMNLELSTDPLADPANPFQSKPEIKHLFKEPEARPPQVVSTVFTLLCLFPILILLILWFKLGVNISNFSFSLSALGFHAGLGSIFALYVYFFLELNMFETVRYLAILGLLTFISGNYLLSSIAKKSK